jgi:hypothetical protein
MLLLSLFVPFLFHSILLITFVVENTRSALCSHNYSQLEATKKNYDISSLFMFWNY